jgi:hypothetical protein
LETRTTTDERAAAKDGFRRNAEDGDLGQQGEPGWYERLATTNGEAEVEPDDGAAVGAPWTKVLGAAGTSKAEEQELHLEVERPWRDDQEDEEGSERRRGSSNSRSFGGPWSTCRRGQEARRLRKGRGLADEEAQVEDGALDAVQNQILGRGCRRNASRACGRNEQRHCSWEREVSGGGDEMDRGLGLQG